MCQWLDEKAQRQALALDSAAGDVDLCFDIHLLRLAPRPARSKGALSSENSASMLLARHDPRQLTLLIHQSIKIRVAEIALPIQKGYLMP